MAINSSRMTKDLIMKRYSKIKEKSYRLHLMWLWLFLIIGVQSRAGDYFPNDRVLITEGQRQFRALIEQNEKNRRDGCTENNVYVFSFLSTDDWSTYIKTYTGAPEFAAPYIVELNDRLKQFNENPALGDYGMYVCIVSELEVRVAFDYTSFNVTALPDIIDAYKRYDKGIPNAGGTFSAANFEQLRVEYQNLIQKIYKGVDDNLGSGNTNYQAYKNKNNRALFTNTAVKIIIPDKDNNDHVEKQRRLYGGTVKGYFKTHLSDILDYEQIMYKDRGQIPFRNRVLSFLEYAEGQMDDPANKQIVSYSDGNANLASAVQGNSNNVVYDNTDINNQQLYLFDYTGVFGTKSQAAQDTINQLLSGQRMANNSKCRVFITDDDVNQTWIDAINNLDLTDSYFDNTLVLWIHVNPDGSTTSTIRLSDDLNAKIKDALTYGRFDQLVQIGLNTSSGSGGPNIGKEVLNFLIEVVYVSSSFLVDVLDALTIPEKIYMVNHADYDPLFKKVFSFVMPVMLVSDFVMQPLFDAYPSLDALGVQLSDVQFALVCGLWNGLVDELKGTFELVSMVGYWVDEEKKAEVEGMINVFREGKIIESIKKGLVEAHTGHPCKIAHTIGKDIVAVVFLVVPYTKGAALSKVRKVVNVLDALNPITHVFDAAGFVMKKAGGKVIDILIPELNGLNDIKIAFVEEDWLIAIEDELYDGLPSNIVAKENLPYDKTAVEVINGNSKEIQAAALALLTLNNGKKVIGRASDVASSTITSLKNLFNLEDLFESALHADVVAAKIALLDNATDLLVNSNLQNEIALLSKKAKYNFFEDLARAGNTKDNSWIGYDLANLNTGKFSLWKGMNAYLDDLEDVSHIIRSRCLRAMMEYPDDYVSAIETFGMSKFKLFKKHADDYGGEYYKIINDFVTSSTSGLTKSEIYAIFGYTTNFFYWDLNLWLREGTNQVKAQAITNLINSGLNKLPIWPSSQAFRGIKIKGPNAQQKIDDIVARYSNSTVVPHGEFISVGDSPTASFLSDPRVKIRMDFNLKMASGAKDISNLADGIFYRGAKKHELLFPAGTSFEVKSISPPQNGVITIVLDEL